MRKRLRLPWAAAATAPLFAVLLISACGEHARAPLRVRIDDVSLEIPAEFDGKVYGDTGTADGDGVRSAREVHFLVCLTGFGACSPAAVRDFDNPGHAQRNPRVVSTAVGISDPRDFNFPENLADAVRRETEHPNRVERVPTYEDIGLTCFRWLMARGRDGPVYTCYAQSPSDAESLVHVTFWEDTIRPSETEIDGQFLLGPSKRVEVLWTIHGTHQKLWQAIDQHVRQWISEWEQTAKQGSPVRQDH